MRKEKKSLAPKIRDERTFHYFALTVLILLALYCIFPFILMLSVSLSTETSLGQLGYRFWPKEISFAAYDYLWAKRATIGRCDMLRIGKNVAGTLDYMV